MKYQNIFHQDQITKYLIFLYEGSDYKLMENKKFQMVVIYDTPERLLFISLGETTGLEKDCIYVRKGTKCEKASASEIESILETKLSVLFKETSELSLKTKSGGEIHWNVKSGNGIYQMPKIWHRSLIIRIF